MGLERMRHGTAQLMAPYFVADQGWIDNDDIHDSSPWHWY